MAIKVNNGTEKVNKIYFTDSSNTSSYPRYLPKVVQWQHDVNGSTVTEPVWSQELTLNSLKSSFCNISDWYADKNIYLSDPLEPEEGKCFYGDNLKIEGITEGNSLSTSLNNQLKYGFVSVISSLENGIGAVIKFSNTEVQRVYPEDESSADKTIPLVLSSSNIGKSIDSVTPFCRYYIKKLQRWGTESATFPSDSSTVTFSSTFGRTMCLHSDEEMKMYFINNVPVYDLTKVKFKLHFKNYSSGAEEDVETDVMNFFDISTDSSDPTVIHSAVFGVPVDLKFYNTRLGTYPWHSSYCPDFMQDDEELMKDFYNLTVQTYFWNPQVISPVSVTMYIDNSIDTFNWYTTTADTLYGLYYRKFGFGDILFLKGTSTLGARDELNIKANNSYFGNTNTLLTSGSTVTYDHLLYDSLGLVSSNALSSNSGFTLKATCVFGNIDSGASLKFVSGNSSGTQVVKVLNLPQNEGDSTSIHLTYSDFRLFMTSPTYLQNCKMYLNYNTDITAYNYFVKFETIPDV